LHTPFEPNLGAFVALSNQQLIVLDQLHSRRKAFVPGRDMIHEGQVDRSACILASGWVCSDKLFPGGTRHIVDFQILGDFPGLRSLLLCTADHNIEPIAPVQTSEVQKADLLDAFKSAPRVATAVLRAASRDEAMVAEHLMDIGRPGTTLTMKVCC